MSSKTSLHKSELIVLQNFGKMYFGESKLNRIESNGKQYIRRPPNKTLDLGIIKKLPNMVEGTLWFGVYI